MFVFNHCLVSLLFYFNYCGFSSLIKITYQIRVCPARKLVGVVCNSECDKFALYSSTQPYVSVVTHFEHTVRYIHITVVISMKFR